MIEEIEILLNQQLQALEKLKEQIDQLTSAVETLETFADLR